MRRRTSRSYEPPEVATGADAVGVTVTAVLAAVAGAVRVVVACSTAVVFTALVVVACLAALAASPAKSPQAARAAPAVIAVRWRTRARPRSRSSVLTGHLPRARARAAGTWRRRGARRARDVSRAASCR